MQAINQFGSAPSLTLTLPGPSNVTPRDSVCLASSPTHNGFGSTSTLKAEILWVLNTVTKHQSYKGNDDIPELFRARGFPTAVKPAAVQKNTVKPAAIEISARVLQ